MAAQTTNLAPPSKTLVEFLASGLAFFHPDVFFEKGEAKEITEEKTWQKYQAEMYDFDIALAAATGTSFGQIEKATALVKDWQSYFESLKAEEPVKLERTVPVSLQEWVEDLEKEKDPFKKREIVKRMTQAAGEVRPESLPARPEATTATSEGEDLILQVMPAATSAFRQATGALASTPFRVAMFLHGPVAHDKNAEETSARALMLRGLDSKLLAKKAEELPDKQKSRLLKLAEAVKRQETIYPSQLAWLRTASPVSDIIALTRAGVTQARLAILLTPSEDGESYILPRQSFVGGFFGSFFQQAFGRAGEAALGALAKKAAPAVAAKLGLQVAAAAVAPGLGNLAVWAALTAKDLWFRVLKLITGKEGEGNLTIGLSGLVAVIGFALGSSVLAFTGLLGVGGGFYIRGAGGVAPAGTSLARLGQAVGVGITHVAFPAVSVPFVITLISIPVVVSVILFIINSGAYIVPPGPDVFTPSESLFIGVTKSGSPSGPFGNSSIPFSVEYIIVVTAKKGSLSNITFGYSCEVIKESAAPGCPPPSSVRVNGEESPSIPQGKQEELIISPATPYEIKYTATYDSHNFDDSAVIDSFIVTADTETSKGERSTGSASIIIGTPPTGCFEFDEDFEADPGKKAIELGAVVELSRAKAYMAELCSGGNITLDLEPQFKAWGGWYKSFGRIVIYESYGLGSHSNAVYTLTHETGHHYANVTTVDSEYTDFSPDVVAEAPLCTYPEISRGLSEDFAEMIALYVADAPSVGRYFSCLDSVGETFRTRYPNHWDFARNKIFHEDLSW